MVGLVSRSILESDISDHPPANVWYVDGALSVAGDGKSWNSAFRTIQAAHDAALAGDRVLIAPGDYDETVTITKDNLTFKGMGARGAVAVAPSAANGIAWVIDGTTATGRVEEVQLINVGGEGGGTGGGLHVKGNVRRFRATGCKFEGGAFGAKIESTGADPLTVGDTIIRDCEFAWTDRGIDIVVSGAGDPVTQLRVEYCWFHNCAADGIRAITVHTTNLQVIGCQFDDDEAGTAPTGLYIDAQVASTTGIIAGCYFPVAVTGSKVLVAATTIVLGCYFTGGLNTTAPT